MKKISLIIICLLLCICTGCGSPYSKSLNFYFNGADAIARISKIMDSKIVDTTRKGNSLDIVFENGVEYTYEGQITGSTLMFTTKIQFDDLDNNKIQLFLLDTFNTEDTEYLADEFYDAYLNGNDYKKEIKSNGVDMTVEMNLYSLENNKKLFVFTLTSN